jgi:Tol biopolymer transport system component
MKDQPPPMNQRQPATPRALERVVRKCLEKKPEDRWRSAHDLKPTLELIDLDAPPPSSASASVPIPVPELSSAPKPRRAWLWPAIAGAAVVIAAAAAGALYLKTSGPARATRFEVTLPEGVQFSQYVSVSPDGHKLVFNATGEKSGLWIRDLDTLQWRQLPGTEGSSSPFWSPDSRFLGFSVGVELKKIEVAGGPPQTLCTSPTAVGTGAWSKDNVILFGGKPNGPLRRVSAAGGIPTEVTAIDPKRGETYQVIPTFLPDGKHFVYLITGSPEVTGIYVGSLDAKPAEQSKERIITTTLGAPYVDGNIFFLREGTLMAQPFDAGKLQLRGEPVPVAEHVGSELSAGYFAVSPTGVLAYRTGATVTAGLQHTWFDRQGKATGTFGEPNNDGGVALSPDGTRAAERDAAPQTRGDIWLLDFARGTRTRLTFRQNLGSSPVWSPDGSRIAFSSGDSIDTIYEKSASGAGEERELLKKPGEIKFPTSWSHDGRFLLYNTFLVPQTGSDLWVLPLEGDRKPVLLLGTNFNEGNGTFSPDGRWVAYASNESGRNEVYVRPFVASGTSAKGGGPSLGEGKWQVSKDGGTNPSWRADGKEIVFSFRLAILSVDVSGSGAAFQMGTPKQLFTAPANNGWDVTGDGKRFMMIVPPNQGQQTAPTPITVVLNWQADSKK